MTEQTKVLCYVDGCWAYFITQPLEEAWGDDWDDAPYEHNAGPPYEYRESDALKGRAPWSISKVAWDGDFDTPCEYFTNSSYSVKQINAKAVAWLVTPKWKSGKIIAIHAGTPFEEFCELIKEGGGNVYLPME